MFSRSDISFAIEMINQFQNNPQKLLGLAHWQVVKTDITFCEASNFVLCYGGGDIHLIGLPDANWIDDKDECKSTSNYSFLGKGRAILWYNKKQLCCFIYGGV